MLNPSVFEVNSSFDGSDLSTEARAIWTVKRKKKFNRTGTVHLHVGEMRDTKIYSQLMASAMFGETNKQAFFFRTVRWCLAHNLISFLALHEI